MTTKDFSEIQSHGVLTDPCEIEAPEDIADYLEEYMDSTNSMLEDLEQAALSYKSGNDKQENASIIRKVPHKIKGESSMVGVDDINELCHQTEDAFEQLPENEQVDILLQFKDWVCAALSKLAKEFQIGTI